MVYAKRPFAGPKQVLRYLGRYTHRVAISNNRLLGDADGKVSFDWKDYKNGSAHKIMTLEADEFIRRFLLHVLPKGLQRIRHFGFLGNRYREHNVAKVRELLGQQPAPSNHLDKHIDYRERYEQLTGHSLLQCPACQRGQMLLTQTLPSPVATPRPRQLMMLHPSRPIAAQAALSFTITSGCCFFLCLPAPPSWDGSRNRCLPAQSGLFDTARGRGKLFPSFTSKHRNRLIRSLDHSAGDSIPIASNRLRAV